MTKIRRTVGTYNEANEIQVAPGIVNSVPIMDYTHTYWDGAKLTSCDECPNGVVCPKCPQFARAEHFNMKAGAKFARDANFMLNSKSEQFRIRGGGVSPRENILDSDFQPSITPAGVEYFDGIPYVANSNDILPTHDLDPGYISSRERMGACRTKQYSSNRAAGYISRSDNIGISDDAFNNGKGITPRRKVCEYVGFNGYIYKEPC